MKGPLDCLYTVLQLTHQESKPAHKLTVCCATAMCDANDQTDTVLHSMLQCFYIEEIMDALKSELTAGSGRLVLEEQPAPTSTPCK